MRKTTMGVFGMLLVATPAAAASDGGHNYSGVECSDKEFLIALLEDINKMPQLRAQGNSIVDITDATTTSRGATKVACHATLTFNDSSKGAVTISLYDNALGQIIFDILPDHPQHTGRRGD